MKPTINDKKETYDTARREKHVMEKGKLMIKQVERKLKHSKEHNLQSMVRKKLPIKQEVKNLKHGENQNLQ